MSRKRKSVIAVSLSVLLGAVVAPAFAADLHLVNEREIYVALDKLNAMGLLPGFFANTRPYDMQEVRKAVGDVHWSGLAVDESTAELGRWVVYQASPAGMLRGGITLSWSDHRRVEENNEGVPTPDGSSARLTALGRYEPLPWL